MASKPFAALRGPRCLPLFGNVLDYSRFGPYSFDRMHLAKIENYNKYGNIYREKFGPVVVVQLFNPDDISTVLKNEGKLPVRPPLPLLKAANRRDGIALGLGSLNGEDWWKLRKTVQKPLMHPRAGAAYLPAQEKVANEFLNVLDSLKDEKGFILNFEELILRYTMESIGTVCFNKRIGVLDEKKEESKKLFSSIKKQFSAVQRTYFAFPWFEIYRSEPYREFLAAKSFSDNFAKSCIMLNRKEILDDDSSPNLLKSLINDTSISEREAVGIITDLFVAGIDSTASALSFILYNLANNKREQRKLFEEIDSVLGSGKVTSQSFDNMPYMKACVKESFRIFFPVQGGTTRVLDKNLSLGGYSIPKKSFVAFNNQTMCLSKEYFSCPDKYTPERWLKRGSASTSPPHPYVMLPFGFGARMCIGRRFAEQEIYLALVKVLHKFEISEDIEKPMGIINRVFNTPDRPLSIKFTKRYF